MIYNLSFPSSSLFSPCDSSHGVVLGCRILVSVILFLASCACMVLVNLITVRTIIIIVARRLRWTFSFPCRFDILFQHENLVLECLDVGLGGLQLRDKLGIACGESCCGSTVRCHFCCELGNCFDCALHCFYASLFDHKLSTVKFLIRKTKILMGRCKINPELHQRFVSNRC
jgi:hypothetical protein